MAIWKTPITIEEITKIRESTMTDALGIEFTVIGDDFLKGKMPVDKRTLQPFGIMHGGASCALAETLGSVAGTYCIDKTTSMCVGISINTNHVGMVREGYVYGTAKPLHLGGKTQIWEIEIRDDQERLVSLSRLTLMVLSRK